MVEEPFRTVEGRGEATKRVKGSRFIGRIAPTPDVETAEALIQEAREEFPDATHVVPAYRVRDDPLREYQSCAGEPTGSAGPPMLSVLQGEELENVVAVVIRYYGGTNLGIGGLVRAYSGTVKQALAETTIVERVPHTGVTVQSTYDDSGTIRSILEGSEATFDGTYEENVTFSIEVPRDAADQLCDRMLSATSGRITIERD